jgi:hypothetical protein
VSKRIERHVEEPGEHNMECYIIRIYHRDGKDPRKVAGVVEETGKEGRRAFLGPDSLWEILFTPSPEPMTAKWGPARRKNRKNAREEPLAFTEILNSLNDDEE